MNVKHLNLEGKSLLQAGRLVLDNQLDITGADVVEVSHSADGTVLWVNVSGICALRICRIKQLMMNDTEVKK